MKFLKKTFAYILPAMMVLGGATACTDFIEIDPENKVPEQGVDFTNKNNMYQPVVGAYSKVYNPQIEMFARFKMKSSFHKTKRII